MESLDGFGYEGFVVDLALAISKIVGFNFTIVPTDGYGSVGKDGRWNGMIRELLEEVKTYSPNETHIIENLSHSMFNYIFINGCPSNARPYRYVAANANGGAYLLPNYSCIILPYYPQTHSLLTIHSYV